MMRIVSRLYVQVLMGVVLGIAVGAFWPQVGSDLKPLGDAFIKLIKMVIGPIIFCTVASGIAHMRDMGRFGRVGLKALVYFEIVSTLALVIGLVVGKLVHPGRGFNIDPATLDPSVAQGYLDKAHASDTWVEAALKLIPESFFSPFAEGNLLQILLVAVLTGFACTRIGSAGERIATVLDRIGELFFAVINLLVRLAPIGAFGAMAFTIGKYGLGSLLHLGGLVATFYATSAMFVIGVLGVIAAATGFSIFRFLAYIKDELLVVLGTSSSESALPQLMSKLTQLGASRAVTGLVVPTGYSFNLDGTNIYMTLATLFLAQATNTPLSMSQELSLLGVAMLTSKGASGVTGAGFITLAATLAVLPDLPIAALAVLVGIDRFMSECRALTNFIGNGVATLVIARWEGELDREKLRSELRPQAVPLSP
jgi:aerobic C4-dicarboxylate transport protein